jgi:biotin transport system substrate-specific component
MLGGNVDLVRVHFLDRCTRIRFGVFNFSREHPIAFSFVLSWIYAAGSQIIINLPFNTLPASFQPILIFVATIVFGWPAVAACFFYLVQGALGAPFFSNMHGGIAWLMSPNGGYLIGFFAASVAIFLLGKVLRNSIVFVLIKIIVANFVIFACGLAWLSFFVCSENLLVYGFYPFVVGDFFVKPVVVLLFVHWMGALESKAL